MLNICQFIVRHSAPGGKFHWCSRISGYHKYPRAWQLVLDIQMEIDDNPSTRLLPSIELIIKWPARCLGKRLIGAHQKAFNVIVILHHCTNCISLDQPYWYFKQVFPIENTQGITFPNILEWENKMYSKIESLKLMPMSKTRLWKSGISEQFLFSKRWSNRNWFFSGKTKVLSYDVVCKKIVVNRRVSLWLRYRIATWKPENEPPTPVLTVIRTTHQQLFSNKEVNWKNSLSIPLKNSLFEKP